jgi:hypothetical protein
LAKQGPIWGDDELLFGFQHLALHTAPEQKVAVWDPLLIRTVTAGRGNS